MRTKRTSRRKDLEHHVKELSADDLVAVRLWFAAFDPEAWDLEFEENVVTGKLGHAAGRSTPL